MSTITWKSCEQIKFKRWIIIEQYDNLPANIIDLLDKSLTGSIADKKETIESAKKEHEAKKRRWAENSDDLEKAS